jgi:hypothetical protein
MTIAARSLLVAALFPLLLGAKCTNNNGPHDVPGPQGWSERQTFAWYTASQGSRMMPRIWLDALEQEKSSDPFLAPANIELYRYLPNPAANWTSGDNCPIDPKLPLGFTVDCQDDSRFVQTKLRWKAGQQPNEQWVGMNCSACHTTQINYSYIDKATNQVVSKPVVVEGAPTLADFQRFNEDLNKALKATLADDAKFGRFATAVLGASAAPGDPALLRAAVQKLLGWYDSLAALNADSGTRYGYGRLDAIGHIFNKVSLVAMAATPGMQRPNPSDAPVSYPFLWNVPQLNRVEWNGIAANTPINGIEVFDAGALGRNTGEVIGVFGDVTITPSPGLAGYTTSVLVDKLNDMELQLRALLPPKWPDELGTVPDKIEAGKKLFADKCAQCHTVPPDRTDLKTLYTVTLTPLAAKGSGTDIWMACNAVFDSAFSGSFTGTPKSVISGTPIPAQAFNLDLLQTAVIGSLLGQKGPVIASALDTLFGFNRGLPLPKPPPPGLLAVQDLKKLRENVCTYAMNNPAMPQYTSLVYKGRPLQGIWATAPYLHNGSVPTLYDLLLPPDQRPKSFYIGTRQFDDVKVGFVTTKNAAGNDTTFDVLDPAGNPIPGNSNAGHDYGNGTMSDDDRYALIEYMKTF